MLDSTRFRTREDALIRPPRSSFLVFGQPDIREPEIDEVVATLRSGWLGTGPRTKQFEDEFAAYVGARHAIALNSCTAGLHLSLLALGIGPGDEVITSAMTFAASVNVILHVGARPVLVDIDPVTHNLDPELVRAAVTPRTKAILPVHMAGLPSAMDEIMAIAAEFELKVVEDAAHATEAATPGRKVGTIGDLTAFSFYVTKNVVTGEGGMVTTDDERLANDLRIRSLHGMSRDAWKRYSSAGFQHYDVVLPGWKYNMTDLQAALGIHQLARVAENLARRTAVWERYVDGLSGIPGIGLPAKFEGGVHARHLFRIDVDASTSEISRDELMVALKAANIGTGVHFRAIHAHSFFASTLSYRWGELPHAERVGDQTLSLPLSSRLSDEDVDDVITAVRSSVPAAAAVRLGT